MNMDTLSVDSHAIWDRELEAHKDDEPMARFNAAMTAVQLEFLSKSPMWMRFNFIGNSLAKISHAGNLDLVDWDKINELLEKDRSPYDFNAYDRITNCDEFYEAAADCRTAGILDTMWYRGICKDCGETFFLSKHDADFFEMKGFAMPKRCKSCRSKRKSL